LGGYADPGHLMMVSNMDKEKNMSLDEFLKSQTFTDTVYKQIFKELVTKYKNENERQHLIRAVILLFERKDPNGMKKFKEMMGKTRELQTNKFASDKKQDQRHLLRLPEELWKRLKLVVEDPEFLKEDKEVDWVVKNFPEFVIPSEY